MFNNELKLAAPFDHGIRVQFVFVTPELADKFELPDRQRPLSVSTAARYEGDMISGDWVFTGDTIKFDTDGKLIDGQHRVRSIIESGKGQWSLIVTGLPTRAILATDQNYRRTVANQLAVQFGTTNANTVAAITNRVWHWTNGNYSIPEQARIPSAPFLNVRPTIAQSVRTFLTWEDELQDAARHAIRLYVSMPKVSPSTIGFAWFLLGRADMDRREKFFHEVSGNPSRISPTYPPAVMHRVATIGQRRLEENRDLRWRMLPYLFETWNRWMTWELAPEGQEGDSLSALSLREPINYSRLPHPIGVPLELPRSVEERTEWDRQLEQAKDEVYIRNNGLATQDAVR